MPSKNTSKGYKDILREVSEMLSHVRCDLYAITKKLCQVFEDSDFRADLGNADDFRAAEALDKHVCDLGFTFLELRSVLQMFPTAEAWAKKPLRDLYAAVIEDHRQRQASDKPTVVHKRVTRKEYEELADKLKTAEVVKRNAEERFQEKLQTIEELLEENQSLKRQLAVAEGRIQELERLLSRNRESAAA